MKNYKLSVKNMHIIFGNVSFWQVPLIKLLKYFKLKISYLLIDPGPELQRNEIANKLKELGFSSNISEMSSPWVGMNLLSVDQETVLVDERLLFVLCFLFCIQM